MNKKLLASAITAALGFSFAANSSMALVNLSDPAASDPVTFASELDLDDPTITPFSCDTFLNAAVNLGFGFSASNSDIFVRYDLNNNATWGTALIGGIGGDLEVTGGSATVSLSSGGGATQNFVIFNVTGSTALPQDTVLTLIPPAINVVSKSPVTLKYALYTTPNAALSNVAGTELASASGTYIDFESLFDLSGSTSTATAEVTEDFKLFSGTNALTQPTDPTAKIGTLKFGTTTGVFNSTCGAAVASDIITTTSTTLTLTGDFAAADTVFLSNDTCSTTATAPAATVAVASDGASATFTIATSDIPAATTAYDLCFTADEVTPMSTGSYLASFEGNSDVEVGAIRRNGVELLAPFVALHSAYVPRFYLTNTSTKDVAFTVSAQTDVASGVPCTLNAPFSDCALPANQTLGWGTLDNAGNVGCSIGAGKSLLIKGPDMFATGKRCSVTFRVASDDDLVHGLYQQRTTATTDFDSYLMISIGSDSAH